MLLDCLITFIYSFTGSTFQPFLTSRFMLQNFSEFAK